MESCPSLSKARAAHSLSHPVSPVVSRHLALELGPEACVVGYHVCPVCPDGCHCPPACWVVWRGPHTFSMTPGVIYHQLLSPSPTFLDRRNLAMVTPAATVGWGWGVALSL